MKNHDPSSRIGTIVAQRWRLDQVLGSGASAVVYAATHDNGSRVAIKILRASAAADPEIVARFTKEGHVGNLVRHPGAVRTLDDGLTDDDLPYLVMDLLEGETLDAHLARRGSMPAPEALRVIDQVLDVLVAAHAVGLVHRDVKPANVFLTTSGAVRLLDFGIAHERVLGRKGDTLAGMVLGTPAYMPPEQARARWKEVDGRSDVWAVGATLFVALTGRLLRDGETSNEELLLAMLPLPSTRMLAPEVPPEVAALLDGALAFDRASRFASAREMQAALRAIAGPSAGVSVAFGPRSSFPEPLPPLPVPVRRLPRGLGWIAAAALVLPAIVLAVRLGGAAPKASAAPSLPDPPAPLIAVRDVPAPVLPATPPVVTAAVEVAPPRAAVPADAGQARRTPVASPAGARAKRPVDPMSSRF